jgi:beta-mannanase
MGAYIPGAPQDTTKLSQFETMTGHRMSIVSWYQPWGYDNGTYTSVLDTGALSAVAARGEIPLITWEAWGTVNGLDPSHLANIPSGAFDSYIDSWAVGLKAFGKPVYLRLFHEMNFQGYPWAYGVNGNTAPDLVTAWRYVHDRFARVGATNVQWVWSPNPDNGLVPFAAIYPGNAYVDWFGVDIYNGGTQFDWGGWLSAQQIMDHTYRLFQTLNPAAPVMLPEVSSVEAGGNKAQWITDLFTAMPGAFPNLKAIVWFHDNWTTVDSRNLPVADWRVNTSLASLQAFRDA